MANQSNVEDAKYLGVYFTADSGGYSLIARTIFGDSIEHLANWGYLEDPIQRCSNELHMFEVKKVDRKIVKLAIENFKQKSEQEYRKEKKSKLLAELKELEDL